MHIYEGGDFSTKQEHLQQTYTKGQKNGMLHFGLYHHSCQLLPEPKRPLAQLGNEL